MLNAHQLILEMWSQKIRVFGAPSAIWKNLASMTVKMSMARSIVRLSAPFYAPFYEKIGAPFFQKYLCGPKVICPILSWTVHKSISSKQSQTILKCPKPYYPGPYNPGPILAKRGCIIGKSGWTLLQFINIDSSSANGE